MLLTSLLRFGSCLLLLYGMYPKHGFLLPMGPASAASVPVAQEWSRDQDTVSVDRREGLEVLPRGALLLCCLH